MKHVVTEKLWFPVLGLIATTAYFGWVTHFAFDFFTNIDLVRDKETLDTYLGGYRLAIVTSGLLSVYVWFYSKQKNGSLATIFIHHPIIPIFVAGVLYMGVVGIQNMAQLLMSDNTKECALVASALSSHSLAEEGMTHIELSSGTSLDNHPFVKKVSKSLVPGLICLTYGLPDIRQAFPAELIFNSVEEHYFESQRISHSRKLNNDRIMKVVITTTPELKAELYKSYLRVRNEKNIIRKKGMLIKAEEVIEEKVGFLGASKKIAKILRRAVRDKIEWDEEKFNKAIIKERRLGSPLKNYYGIRYSELEALDHAIYMANGNPYQFHEELRGAGINFDLWPILLGEKGSKDMLNAALLKALSPYAIILLLFLSLLSTCRSIGFFMWRIIVIFMAKLYNQIRYTTVKVLKPSVKQTHIVRGKKPPEIA